MSNTQNAVSVFNFENQQFDVLTIEGNPWFIGKQVCNILGYQNTTQAIQDNVDEDDTKVISQAEIKKYLSDSFAPPRGLTIINESGLYSLILKSQLPSAKKFKRWVTSEVLPSIRKTGKYEIPKNDIDEKYKSEDFSIEGIDGFFDEKGMAYFRAYDVAFRIGLTLRSAHFEEVNWIKMEALLSKFGKNAIEHCGLLKEAYIKEPALFELVATLRTRACKEFKKTLTFSIIPELKKYTHYKPHVTTTEVARVAPFKPVTLRHTGNSTVTNVVKDVGGAAEEIVRIFGASKIEALEAAVSLAEQSSGLNLEPLREIIDSVEATTTIEAIDGDDW